MMVVLVVGMVVGRGFSLSRDDSVGERPLTKIKEYFIIHSSTTLCCLSPTLTGRISTRPVAF